MNKDDISGMVAGPELNRLVAENVMGYLVYHYDKDCEDFSGSIEVAWQVVEKMQKVMISKYGNDKWHVVIDTGENGYTFGEGFGKTAPEAICKAALIAMMEVEKE